MARQNKKRTESFPGRWAAALAFLAAFCFFQFAYPYHLVRREQMTLFVYDWDYIFQTYRGDGWLARLASDFLEQFFHLPVAGPLFVALLLTGIGAVVYKISRKFLGRWPSLGIAAAFYVWSFFRETGNLYITRYTVVMLAYLSLILLALQLRRAWLRPVAAAALLAAGVWTLGAPFHHHYGKPWSVPRIEYDRVIGLDDETAREHWDKVLKLSRKDLHMREASYCYNLAHAMKGDLGEALFNHSQDHHWTLLFQVSGDQTVFTNGLAGEAWFHVGDMTVAEQSAITSLQASPKHTGARYLVRLARVNLISGEEAAAQKYLDLLSKTLFYGKWARSMMPGRQDAATRAELDAARANLVRTDFVHHSDVPRSVLLSLLEVNPSNRVARNYLLCFDLLRYDLEEFMQDYAPDMIPARIYHEAVLIWLSQHDRLSEAELARYGVDAATVDRMNRFGRAPGKYRNTYWYYYMQALEAR
ncbi:hypothetical protein SAMN06298214_1316 [Bacteroidales bacterium WCE2004]|nr:hypothetical protein SAMN06298214_1316 [Bacteroidales bacterium WCE2004]